MKIKLSEISELIGGKIFGDPELEISKLSNIQDAENGDLTFLYMESYNEYLKTTKASAVLIPPKFEKVNKSISYIEVDKPNLAFQKVIDSYFKPEFKLSGIDKSAQLNDNIELGDNVALGKNVVISNK